MPSYYYVGAAQHRSFDSMTTILLFMLTSFRKKYPEFDLNGKNVIEIGSGTYLSHPIALRMLGAKTVTSIDLEIQLNRHAANRSLRFNTMSTKILSAMRNIDVKHESSLYSECLASDDHVT
ncbi:hypothetical protein N9E31_03120, partial [Paracoccaceae bacterium]|nr:hypothetical protein [Paracoccaceae bacterium]